MGYVILVILVLVLLGAWAVTKRNRLITLANLVAESWRQVDVELRRRHDLVPNLVHLAQAYAQYERATLAALTTAREDAMTLQTPAQRAGAEDRLGKCFQSALVQAEAFPTLAADRQFIALQRELAETEDRIAAGRRIYNSNARALNTAIAIFPGSLLAGAAGVQPAQYFEAADPAVQSVVPCHQPCDIPNAPPTWAHPGA